MMGSRSSVEMVNQLGDRGFFNQFRDKGEIGKRAGRWLARVGSRFLFQLRSNDRAFP